MKFKLFLLFSLISFAVFGQKSKFPKLVGFVNDFEQLFTAKENAELTKIITDFEKKTSNEIAIVTVSNIGKYTDFNKFCFDLSNQYGIGKKGKDNGLTIVFSQTLKKVRINTGTGTEKNTYQ